MLPTDDSIQYLVGSGFTALDTRPLPPYNDLTCSFLNELSNTILHAPEARLFPDVVSFAYWCRKANVTRLKQEFGQKHHRLGLGLAFHIAPSNVPVNFAFSFVFSLLAGNANVVRVPSKDFAQTGIICSAINSVLADPKYRQIADMTAFVRYEQDDTITGAFSALCDARIIWGGDATITNIRRLPTPVRCVEIAFSDRYSFCVIDPAAIAYADDSTIERLAAGFYNDVYLMDQNACSSPHLIVWLGDDAGAKARFWQAVAAQVEKRYELSAAQAVDKLTLACADAIDRESVVSIKRYSNYVYLADLSELPQNTDELRGQYGYFYQYTTDDLNSTAPIVNGKYQTLTYFGSIQTELANYVVNNRLAGIDRIVPIGQALDINVVWDGYDLVQTLSRIIDVR